MTPMHVFQATVILGCVVVMWRSGGKRYREASRSWWRHPFTIRALAQERRADTPAAFVLKLDAAGIDAEIARAVRSEIQVIVGVYYGLKHFPVRAEDELQDTYLFSLGDYTGYPGDPDLFGSAAMIIKATKRRVPKEPELRLAQLRTVLDLARWVQELPAADDRIPSRATGDTEV